MSNVENKNRTEDMQNVVNRDGLTADSLPETAVLEAEVERILNPDADDFFMVWPEKGRHAF